MDVLNGTDFRIEKRVIGADYKAVPVNISDCYEILYIFGGQKKYFINNSLYNAARGDTILISEGDISYDRSELLPPGQSAEYYVITFSLQFLQKLSNMLSIENLSEVFSCKKICIPDTKKQHFEELILMLSDEYTGQAENSEKLINLYISEILIYLMRFSEYICETSQNSQEKCIETVCRHICNYYNEQLTLADMARLAYMSPTYFSKKFKKITGFGFNEYLNNIRVKIAINMLVNTKHSITEIAVYCGYQDSNYFGDVFRRIVGVSPSKYRKTHH